MNYKQKKKLFQNLTLTTLQANSTFLMFFQINNINSLKRVLLIKELNKVNFKLQIFHTKLLKRKKFVVNEPFAINFYTGLFVVFSTTSDDYFTNINLFFKFINDFKVLLPLCVVFFKTLFFMNHLLKIANLAILNQGLFCILLIGRFSFFQILKKKQFLS